MPRFSDQQSVISNQDLKTRPRRRFVSDPRLPGKARTGRPLVPDPKGFTLIELLVVIAVIGILSVVVLAGYNSFGARQEVKNAAAELKSELRKYQTLAIAGQKRPDQNYAGCTDSDPSNPPEITLESYGIAIVPGDPTPYEISLNCNSAPPPPPSPPPLVDKPPWSGDVEITETGYVETGTTTKTPCSGIAIFFKPTNQKISLQCNAVEVSGISPNSGDRVYMILSNPPANTATYIVYVTYAGEIYEEKQ